MIFPPSAVYHQHQETPNRHRNERHIATERHNQEREQLTHAALKAFSRTAWHWRRGASLSLNTDELATAGIAL